MSLRIGIDMDGTLIDNLSVWKRHYNDHKTAHRHREVYGDTPTWDYPIELCLVCYLQCVGSPAILRESRLMRGAAEGLATLVEDGAQLHLITHRPVALESEVRRLLVRRQVAQFFTSVIVTTSPKSEVARVLDLDFHLDDSPHVYADIKATRTTPIIFSQLYNRDVTGLRVHSWPEFAEQMTIPMEVA